MLFRSSTCCRTAKARCSQHSPKQQHHGPSESHLYSPQRPRNSVAGRRNPNAAQAVSPETTRLTSVRHHPNANPLGTIASNLRTDFSLLIHRTVITPDIDSFCRLCTNGTIHTNLNITPDSAHNSSRQNPRQTAPLHRLTPDPQRNPACTAH